jgi:hypothetical protein
VRGIAKFSEKTIFANHKVRWRTISREFLRDSAARDFFRADFSQELNSFMITVGETNCLRARNAVKVL